MSETIQSRICSRRAFMQISGVALLAAAGGIIPDTVVAAACILWLTDAARSTTDALLEVDAGLNLV